MGGIRPAERGGASAHPVPRFVPSAGDVVIAFRTMTADPNDPDLHAVATAYRNARIAGKTDNAAYGAAVAAYRERHPDPSDIEVLTMVSTMLGDAYDAYGQWIHGDDR